MAFWSVWKENRALKERMEKLFAKCDELAAENAVLLEHSGITNPGRYRTKTIPSAGMLLKEEDSGNKQQSFEV